MDSTLAFHQPIPLLECAQSLSLGSAEEFRAAVMAIAPYEPLMAQGTQFNSGMSASASANQPAPPATANGCAASPTIDVTDAGLQLCGLSFNANMHARESHYKSSANELSHSMSMAMPNGGSMYTSMPSQLYPGLPTNELLPMFGGYSSGPSAALSVLYSAQQPVHNPPPQSSIFNPMLLNALNQMTSAQMPHLASYEHQGPALHNYLSSNVALSSASISQADDDLGNGSKRKRRAAATSASEKVSQSTYPAKRKAKGGALPLPAMVKKEEDTNEQEDEVEQEEQDMEEEEEYASAPADTKAHLRLKIKCEELDIQCHGGASSSSSSRTSLSASPMKMDGLRRQICNFPDCVDRILSNSTRVCQRHRSCAREAILNKKGSHIFVQEENIQTNRRILSAEECRRAVLCPRGTLSRVKKMKEFRMLLTSAAADANSLSNSSSASSYSSSGSGSGNGSEFGNVAYQKYKMWTNCQCSDQWLILFPSSECQPKAITEKLITLMVKNPKHQVRRLSAEKDEAEVVLCGGHHTPEINLVRKTSMLVRAARAASNTAQHSASQSSMVTPSTRPLKLQPLLLSPIATQAVPSFDPSPRSGTPSPFPSPASAYSSADASPLSFSSSSLSCSPVFNSSFSSVPVFSDSLAPATSSSAFMFPSVMDGSNVQ